MSALWTSEDAAKATGGLPSGPWQANSVSIDSRTITPGALYIALKGERVDGHEFVKQALERGAVAAVVNAPVPGVDESRLLWVQHTAKALTALGHAARKRSNAKIIGITGSIGKTTTKEMVALMCSAFGNTFATKGNFNNHFGVPLMLANMPLETQFGIFEMGMNHAGEIGALSEIVQPHVAVITTVEAVHLEFFQSVGEIADAKSEIFNGLLSGGTIILNRDNAYFERCVENAERLQLRSIIKFGRHTEADIQLVAEADTNTGKVLTVQAGGQHLAYSIAAHGEGPVMASLVALAVAGALKLDMLKAARSLGAFSEVEGRGRLQDMRLEGKPMWWIDDSYNAGPTSMVAAFRKLAGVRARQASVTRSVAVLGDMLELGMDAARFHAHLADELKAQHIDKVYTAGPLMEHLAKVLPANMCGRHVSQALALEPILRKELQAGDVVLFKGSHGSKIYALVDQLQSATNTANTA